MNEQIRAKIQADSHKALGVKNLSRLRMRLKDLAELVPPPDYDRYIRSKAWKIKRDQFLNHFKNKCVLCGNKQHLHVHHLHYKSVGQETVDDVTVCCRRCHFIEHLPHNDDPHWVSTSAAQHTKQTKSKP